VSILTHHGEFYSDVLGEARPVVVYTPAGYARDTRRRYPLLLLHDGQNVFSGETSYLPGEYWRVRESADDLQRRRAIEPLLIAAIYHAGAERKSEYTPPGVLRRHGRMVVEELLPFLHGRYRLLPHARHTGLGGSSLGGLATLYLACEYPDVFGKLAIMSPSVWWNHRAVLRRLQQVSTPRRPRIWLDIGSEEGGALRDARLLKATLVSKGWREGRSLHYEESDGAGHCEAAWASRVPSMLRFLYPA
jgi:enterochelin esterase-like enzyme